MAGLATVMKLGPLVITPSMSNRQAKFGYREATRKRLNHTVELIVTIFILSSVGYVCWGNNFF